MLPNDLFYGALSKGAPAVAAAPFCWRNFSSNLENSCMEIISSSSITCSTPLTSSI